MSYDARLTMSQILAESQHYLALRAAYREVKEAHSWYADARYWGRYVDADHRAMRRADWEFHKVLYGRTAL